MRWWGRQLGVLGGLLLVLLLGAGLAGADEPKKFTLINVVLDGTKILAALQPHSATGR